MATKLGLFNAALVDLAQRRVTDTGEGVEAARELVAVYDNVLADCIAEASWNFAMETIQADADTGVTPEFGFTEVFAKPSDWVRTIGVSQDENFVAPLIHYYDDDNFWSADVTPIYIRYVSNDTGLGYDLQRWPAAFRRYVELSLADRVCLKVNQAAAGRIESKLVEARKKAKNVDAMNEANPKFPPRTSWSLARGGGNRERGSRGSLIG